MTKKVRLAITILILSEFLVCLGISLVIPVMPFLRNEYHFTATDMGVMTSLFAFAQFAASPIIGRISDRAGRKPVLVIGLLLYMVSEIVFAWTNQLLFFNVSRIIGGLSAAMVVPTSMAMAADITTKRQRAKVIGYLSAAFSGGLILGPGLGGILARIDYKFPFWAAAALGLLSMISLAIFLPKEEDLIPKEQIAKEVGPLVHRGKMKDILTTAVVLLFAMILISSFGLQGFESIYSLYVNQVFHFTMSDIALVLTINGVLSLILQVVLFDRLVLAFQEKRVIRYAFLISLIGTLWIVLAHNKWEVVIATLFAFTAFDLLRPAITSLITKISSGNQGFMNGLNMSLTSIGNIIGPIMSGELLDMNPHYPYVVVAGFLAVSFLMTYLLRNTEERVGATTDD